MLFVQVCEMTRRRVMQVHSPYNENITKSYSYRSNTRNTLYRRLYGQPPCITLRGRVDERWQNRET